MRLSDGIVGRPVTSSRCQFGDAESRPMRQGQPAQAPLQTGVPLPVRVRLEHVASERSRPAAWKRPAETTGWRRGAIELHENFAWPRARPPRRDSPKVVDKLRRVRTRFASRVRSEPPPWSRYRPLVAGGLRARSRSGLPLVTVTSSSSTGAPRGARSDPAAEPRPGGNGG